MSERDYPEKPNQRFTDEDRRRIFGPEIDEYTKELGGNYESYFKKVLGIESDEPLNILPIRHGAPLPKEANAVIFLSGPTDKSINSYNEVTSHFASAARRINDLAANLPGSIVVILPESHLPFHSLQAHARDKWIRDAQETSDAIIHLGVFSGNAPGRTVQLELAGVGNSRPAFVYLPEDSKEVDQLRTRLENNGVQISKTVDAAIDKAIAYITPVLNIEPRKGIELTIPPDVWLSPEMQDWYQDLKDTPGMKLVNFRLKSVEKVGKGYALFKISEATIYDPIDAVLKSERLVTRPPVKAVLATKWNYENPMDSQVLVVDELRLSASSGRGKRAATLPGGSSSGDTRDSDKMQATAISEFEEETGVKFSDKERREITFLEKLQLQEAYGFTQYTFQLDLAEDVFIALQESIGKQQGNVEKEGERTRTRFVTVRDILKNDDGQYSMSLQSAVATLLARRM